MPAVTPAFRPLFTVTATLSEIRSLGAAPLGERRVIDILGGTVEGPGIRGRILPGGADWQIFRRDGVADIEARYTIELEDGTAILVFSSGLRHGPAEVIARLAAGETVDPGSYYFRTVMRFETGHADHDRFNRMLALALGRRDPQAVVLEVFEVL